VDSAIAARVSSFVFFVSFLLCVAVALCLVGVVPFLGVAAVVDLGFFLWVLPLLAAPFPV